MSGQSQSTYARLGINGSEVCFKSITPLGRYGLVNAGRSSVCGSRSHPKQRTAPGLVRLAWKIVLEPSPNELDVILPLIGFTESPADTFKLTDDFSSLEFPLVIDSVARVNTTALCMISRAIFRGQKGDDPVQLELLVVGKKLAMGASGSFADSGLTQDVVYAFHNSHDGTNSLLDIWGTKREFDRFVLLIDNHVAVQHNNSRHATGLQPTDLSVVLAVNCPWLEGTTDDMFETPGPDGDITGGTGQLKFDRTDVSKSTTFDFHNIKSIPSPPGPISKEVGEIRLPLTFDCFSDGTSTNREVVVTHDATT